MAAEASSDHTQQALREAEPEDHEPDHPVGRDGQEQQGHLPDRKPAVGQLVDPLQEERLGDQARRRRVGSWRTRADGHQPNPIGGRRRDAQRAEVELIRQPADAEGDRGEPRHQPAKASGPQRVARGDVLAVPPQEGGQDRHDDSP